VKAWGGGERERETVDQKKTEIKGNGERSGVVGRREGKGKKQKKKKREEGPGEGGAKRKKRGGPRGQSNSPKQRSVRKQ